MDAKRLAWAWTVALLVAGPACAESNPAPATPPADPRTAWVEIAGELFELEVAADPAARYRGLSGRSHIPRNGGMLFVFPEARPLAFVMRDCPVPIDLAFLDDEGRIVALHPMQPEPPRRPGESAAGYERRLRRYGSGLPARFAIETAGGRLAEVGAARGQRPVFDREGLASLAR